MIGLYRLAMVSLQDLMIVYMRFREVPVRDAKGHGVGPGIWQLTTITKQARYVGCYAITATTHWHTLEMMQLHSVD